MKSGFWKAKKRFSMCPKSIDRDHYLLVDKKGSIGLIWASSAYTRNLNFYCLRGIWHKSLKFSICRKCTPVSKKKLNIDFLGAKNTTH